MSAWTLRAKSQPNSRAIISREKKTNYKIPTSRRRIIDIGIFCTVRFRHSYGLQSNANAPTNIRPMFNLHQRLSSHIYDYILMIL